MGKLIRLELSNFKSYKGQHTLLFGDSYFTSIIGPNGSGKSNSMDAISFVLGIKSSHLRSTNLRDLVYRGRILKTSKIQADGTAIDGGANGHTNGHVNGDVDQEDESTQSGTQRNDPQTAYVMAVFEDDAGDEQRWKRSITSGGQSEYRINNRVVNAKQYNEALEAESILIKARNFLVFQGDVEAIASQSPKDLTRLVEQISGSLEYKAEYERLDQEQTKAADDLTFKLNQRRGINSEIKQYSEQKREADDYTRKVEERDEAIVSHVLWKLYHFQRVIEESGAEIQKHQDELKEHRRGIQKYETRLEDAKKDHAKAARDVSKAERTIKATEKEVEEKKNEMFPNEEKITISNKNLGKHQERITSITKERDAQSRTVDQLKKDLGLVQKAQSKWEDEWKKQAKKEGRQLKEADFQEYNRLKADVNKETASAQTLVDNLTRQRKTDEETVNSLASKLTELDIQVNKVESELTDTRERRDAMNSQAKEASTEIDSKKKVLNNLTSERLRTNQKHTELEEKLQDVLLKLKDADDGRQQSKKETRERQIVADMKRIFPGVKGRVHELCKPKQKKFETAVSTVLGRHFASVVVDTEKTAKECIIYLREARAGQATFIPLDSIQVQAVSSNLKGMHKNMRLAIDTVDYENNVERAIAYACGSAMVCDDLATAKYLCYEKGVESKAVTLDGTIIHKGGLMTGGRNPNDKNSRKWEDNEVENLLKLKDKLMADLAALPKGRKAATDEESLQGELTGLEQRLTYSQGELKALDKNIQSKKKELDFVQKQLKEIRPNYKEQSQGLESLKVQISQHQDTVNAVEDGLFAAFCHRLKYDNIREYEAQQGTLQQEAEIKKAEFAKQTGKLENQLEFETRRLESTSGRIAKLEDAGQRDRELIASLEAEKEAMQTELHHLAKQLTGNQQTAKKFKAVYDDRATKLEEEKRDLQKRNKDAEFVMKAVTELEAEVQRNASGRYGLLRSCKIDEIQIPLTDDSATLDTLPVDEVGQNDPNAMDVDEDPTSSALQAPEVQDYGIEVSFDNLDDDLRDDSSPEQDSRLQSAIAVLNAELDQMTPNMRAIDRLETATNRLRATDDSFEEARRAAKEAKDAFEAVKAKRLELFNKAQTHISDRIGPIYKEITKSADFPLGGQAYLDTMGGDEDTPFLDGLKYHAMPPLKRFRDMDALSGGEKTIAALALLFAVHSYAPSPFFVLDEVDAALDNTNVAKVAKYIREHAGPGTQFIVISLKTGLFQESECLIGVLRDQGANTSRAVTLDLRKYQPS